MDMPPTRYVRTPDGVDLAYRVFDGGPADLVIVPEHFKAMEVYWEWPGVRQLSIGFASFSRLVEYDGRGSGLSGRTGSPPNLETRMRDVGVILDATGLERAALYATADGGAVAALFAATFPDRVTSLALFHPSVRTAWAEDFPWGHAGEDPAERHRHIQEIWHTSDPSPEHIAYLSDDVGELALDPAFRRLWARSVRYTMTQSEFEDFDDIWMDSDVRNILPSIQAPTIVLYRPASDDDHALHSYIADAIPGATLEELPGPPYFLQVIGDIDAIVDAVAGHLQVERPAPTSDRMLASILFTDIVDSTRRAAELGDATWKELLAQHDEIERAHLERFGGRFVHTTGDGMLATFDGPARAVHCARAIATAVRPLGVEIRAGVHTGEVELLRGEVQGLAVHIGARVAAKAGPSEVWVSRTVKDLVAGSGLTFEDAGEYELKGVPDRWRLYRVVG